MYCAPWGWLHRFFHRIYIFNAKVSVETPSIFDRVVWFVSKSQSSTCCQDTFDVNPRSWSRELSGTGWKIPIWRPPRIPDIPRLPHFPPRLPDFPPSIPPSPPGGSHWRPGVEKAPIAVAVPELGRGWWVFSWFWNAREVSHPLSYLVLQFQDKFVSSELWKTHQRTFESWLQHNSVLHCFWDGPGGTFHIPFDELEDLARFFPLVKETKPELAIPLQGRHRFWWSKGNPFWN